MLTLLQVIHSGNFGRYQAFIEVKRLLKLKRVQERYSRSVILSDSCVNISVESNLHVMRDKWENWSRDRDNVLNLTNVFELR